MHADLTPILPALWVLAAGLVAVGVDLFLKKDASRAPLDYVAYAGLGGAIYMLVRRLAGLQEPVYGFYDAVVLDDMATILSLAICAATSLLVMLSVEDIRRRKINFGEYYGLVLLSASGMMLLVASNDFITLFVSLEVMSLAVYVLTGITRANPRSNEAAVKYLVTGGLATGFLLFGMAFLYGATGSIRLDEIGMRLARGDESPLFSLGAGLMMVGFAFKVGAAPFHMWVPDVYEGAPTTITSFMSVTVKAAGFGAMIRVLLTTMHARPEMWGNVVWGLALVTMVAGNLLALGQRSVKRMLAYSSVAHTGYVLVGLAAMRGPHGLASEGGAAAVFYLFVYTFMTLGAFAFLAYLGREVGIPGRPATEWQDGEDIDDFAGLAHRRPWAALAMTVFMVSLGGIPPTAGFFGKFYLFKEAVRQQHYVLAVVGVLASLVSVYYYLRVVVYMYMKEPGPADERPDPSVGVVVATTAFLTILLGLYPSALYDLASHSMGLLHR